MSDAASGLEQDVRHHYTLVCQCEWDEDEWTRTTNARNCVMHGEEPDPLHALLVELERLRQIEDRWLVAAEAFSSRDYNTMQDALLD